MNIEQTVSAAVADLQLGHTFTIDDLIHAIQARRQRVLRVLEGGGEGYGRSVHCAKMRYARLSDGFTQAPRFYVLDQGPRPLDLIFRRLRR